MICRYCLKPNIKTTCSSEMLAQSCISMHMHLMIAFVKLLLLSSYYCIHRGRKRCNSKVGSSGSFDSHIFAVIFLRFSMAPCFTVQTGQGLLGEEIFCASESFFGTLFAAEVCDKLARVLCDTQ